MGQKIEMVSFENIPDYTGLERDSASITIKEGCTWEGHKYGTFVGRIFENGEVKSAFNKDNGNTEIFDRLRKDVKLIEKHVTTHNERLGLEGATDYYIPYMVKDHCSNKPTVTDSYVDHCNNVHYSVEYEILLTAGDGYIRYITVPFETEGHWASNFFDQVEGIEEMFEEWFEEESHDFREGEDGKEVAFYDEVGEKLFIEVSSIRELLSMITSIRVIKCDTEIMN